MILTERKGPIAGVRDTLEELRPLKEIVGDASHILHTRVQLQISRRW